MSSDYLKKTLLADEVARAEAVGAVEAALVESVAEPVDEVRDKQVLIRVSESQRDQWQECAEADGLSVSEWLRQMADARWREVFTCMHPLEKRKSYPWSEFCLDCGSRLR
jgi:hypothetical protein